MRNILRKYWIIVLILFVPFIVLYWMTPFVSKTTIGNDYSQSAYAIHEQLELMFSLANGSFPLYAPGYAGGQSSSALTLGQVYHPLAHIAASIPGYWDGKALEINTLLRLLSLGACQAVVFCWLRRTRIAAAFAFLVSFVTVYNLRMLDLFRYAASLENYIAFLVLSCAVLDRYQHPAGRLNHLGVILGTYLLICGGHPQMAYIGFCGILFIILVTPSYSRSLGESYSHARAVEYYRDVFGLVVVGVLLSAVYILPFCFDVIGGSPERIRKGYEWAISPWNTNALHGIVTALVDPLHGNVHAAFGSSALILLPVLIPLLLLWKPIDRVILVIWGAAIVLLLLMTGRATPLYYLLWKYFPLASYFRVPGRFSMILPSLLLMLWAWLLKQESLSIRRRQQRVEIAPCGLLALAVLIVVAGFHLCVSAGWMGWNESFSPARINAIPAWIYKATVIAGVLVLGTLIGHGLWPRPVWLVWLLMLAGTAQVVLTLRYGTWVAGKSESWTYEQMAAHKRRNLNYAGKATAFAAPAALARYLALMHKHRIDKPLARVISRRDARVSLEYSSYNRLMFHVFVPASDVMQLAYPYSTNWRAKVDGQTVPVDRERDLFLAVRMPAGDHQIEFRYWSWAAVAGMLISSIVLVAIMWHLLRFSALLFVAGLLTYLLCTWGYGLYHGGDLHTQFTWTSASHSQGATTSSETRGESAGR